MKHIVKTYMLEPFKLNEPIFMSGVLDGCLLIWLVIPQFKKDNVCVCVHSDNQKLMKNCTIWHGTLNPDIYSRWYGIVTLTDNRSEVNT
jgi:hypothetical protein